MINFNPIQLAYGLMIVGMMFCFVLFKQNKKEMRKACDEFAVSFVKLSNFIYPNNLKEGLAVETFGDGKIKALDIERQPYKIKQIVSQSNEDVSVQLFAEMVKSADKITRLAGINRTRRQQFSDPINRILYITHTFLNGCENLDTIDTLEKKKDFDSFIQEQVTHRMVLLKRISGEMAEEYRNLNRNYLNEMKAIEQVEQKEAQMKKLRQQ